MTEPAMRVRVPGRVNLIGDHTDYTGGLVLPMAIDRWTTIEGRLGGDRLRLRSDAELEPADVALAIDDPGGVQPLWARYVAGVVRELRGRARGFTGTVTTTLPVGAGLSSSAALEVAVALALGCDDAPLELALACQRAERAATGVPCGIMDQLSIAAAVAGHLTLIDCHDLTVTPVALPPDVEVVVVYGHGRTLDGSDYAQRGRECAAAEAQIGPLRVASTDDVRSITDPLLRARARHVVTENERVRVVVDALRRGDVVTAGRAMDESHASLRDDFTTSTPRMDELVAALRARPGVHGVRMTGGGFGGCAVALTTPGAIDTGWRVRPLGGPVVDQLEA
jgi:galactokinase